jgi:hypothetical protein
MLRQASAEGLSYVPLWHRQLEYRFDCEGLADYEPYRELIRPKDSWPRWQQPSPERHATFGTVGCWKGLWEGFAANRSSGRQRKAEARVSNDSNWQRYAKESNTKQNLGKNLKTAAGNPLRVRVPRPPLDAGSALRRPRGVTLVRVLARISGRPLRGDPCGFVCTSGK